MSELIVGNKMPNVPCNADILAIKLYSLLDEDRHLRVVLCYMGDNMTTPWVTWFYNLWDHFAFEGDYHELFGDAMHSFTMRGI